ncbi:sugar phosphate isomerase/epimerase family protein [Cohnella suwonensis]|uniref:Sugar phosphate isomerase/epimerase family protein n=1 Tax=Cohnella suwonensis TaxID=696072 RepID=A0ABW0LZ89_9BACL
MADQRLDVQMSWWAMDNLSHSGGERLTVERKVRMIAESGFDGINGFIPKPEEADEWFDLLERYGLSFSLNAYPSSMQDLADFLKRAATLRRADFINLQVMKPFAIGEEAVKLLGGLDALAREAGIPAFIETHRGTVTQDLIRTAEFVEALPDLRLTIDYSHYVVAGELHTVSPEAEAWLGKLLPRTHSIHARVSNGEQVQVDCGEKGEHPMLAHFVRWWREGMRHWRADPGNEGKTFPVVIELGPPPYAITSDELGARTQELGDRWRQSLYLMKLVRELWDEAG